VIFKGLAFALMLASSVWMLCSLTELTKVTPDKTVDELEGEGERMRRRTAVWEASVALVLITLEGWSALPNAIVLGCGVGMLWLMPRFL
jgi:hypothetical protein